MSLYSECSPRESNVFSSLPININIDVSTAYDADWFCALTKGASGDSLRPSTPHRSVVAQSSAGLRQALLREEAGNVSNHFTLSPDRTRWPWWDRTGVEGRGPYSKPNGCDQVADGGTDRRSRRERAHPERGPYGSRAQSSKHRWGI